MSAPRGGDAGAREARPKERHKSFSGLWQFGNLRLHGTHAWCRIGRGGMQMKWTMMGAAVLAASLTTSLATAMAQPIELQWWHAMTSVNADRVNKIAADFNASQATYKIVPVFKGSYAETMNAGVAAYRAGNAPHIIQIFEIGTATIMAAKGAVGFPLFGSTPQTSETSTSP